MHLRLTYSAYREMEQISGEYLREVSEAVVDLADEPLPERSARFADKGNCYLLPVSGYYVLYHIDDAAGMLTVLGVLNGPVHTLH